MAVPPERGCPQPQQPRQWGLPRCPESRSLTHVLRLRTAALRAGRADPMHQRCTSDAHPPDACASGVHRWCIAGARGETTGNRRVNGLKPQCPGRGAVLRTECAQRQLARIFICSIASVHLLMPHLQHQIPPGYLRGAGRQRDADVVGHLLHDRRGSRILKPKLVSARKGKRLAVAGHR